MCAFLKVRKGRPVLTPSASNAAAWSVAQNFEAWHCSQFLKCPSGCSSTQKQQTSCSGLSPRRSGVHCPHVIKSQEWLFFKLCHVIKLTFACDITYVVLRPLGYASYKTECSYLNSKYDLNPTKCFLCLNVTKPWLFDVINKVVICHDMWPVC